MVDQEQYNSQILYQQFQEGMEIPQIRCKIHQNSLVEGISLNKDSNNLLFCFKCALSNRMNFKSNKFIIIEELFQDNSQKIIQNWPPLKSKDLCKQLNSINVLQDERNEQMTKTNQKFDQLRKDIMKIIDDHENKMIAHINMIEDSRQSFFKVYNEISSKEEIKTQFQKKQNNMQELEDSLKSIILQKQKQFKQNEQMIKEQEMLSFDHITSIAEQISSYLKSIEFLNTDKKQILTNNIQCNKIQPSYGLNIKFQEPEIQQQNEQLLQDKLLNSYIPINNKYFHPYEYQISQKRNVNLSNTSQEDSNSNVPISDPSSENSVESVEEDFDQQDEGVVEDDIIDSGYTDEEIRIVMDHGNCTKAQAITSLREFDGDIVAAIISIQEKQ